MWRATRCVHIHEAKMKFQSSPSCGGRRNIPFHRETEYFYFNPRPRVEGDLICRCQSDIFRLFQSSPSCGGRLYMSSCTSTTNYISILALVWRATSLGYAGLYECVISILALVWRATNENFDTTTPYGISILALVWRATRSTVQLNYAVLFQSSPSCGGRRYLIYSNINFKGISILALVWRATL